MRGTLPLLVLFSVACQRGGEEPLPRDATPPSCASGETYPAGAVEPMAHGEVLAPYAWPEARHLGTGQTTSLDLAQVPCAAAPDIDWSPFDVLLFVSIPAW
jgi:hypothetical protein